MRAPAQGTNLTFSIAQDLGLAIVTGRYQADAPFPVESDLCKQYGASRSILREAVKMLTAKGLLSARPRQGTRVQPEMGWNLLDPDVLRWLLERKFSLSLLAEFTEIRFAIEPQAAGLAARKADAADRATLAAAIERMAAATTDMEESLNADIGFHVAVLRASKNRFYSELEKLVEIALRFSIRQTNRTKGVSQASVEDHRRIAEAIIGGDDSSAETLMRALIQEAMDLIREAVAAAEPIK